MNSPPRTPSGCPPLPSLTRRTALCLSIILIGTCAWNGVAQVAKQGAGPIGTPFPAVADTSILQNAPDNNMGGHPFMVTGFTAGMSPRRGLLRFDLSSIPEGSIIISATLVVNVSKTQEGATLNLGLYPMFVDWGEGNKAGNIGAPAEPGEAKWNSPIGDPVPGIGWPSMTPGGAAPLDFAPGPVAVVPVFGVSQATFIDPMLRSVVESWVNAPTGNFGLMLKDTDEIPIRNAIRIDSKESPNVPTLYVDFTEPTTLSMTISAPSIAENAGPGSGVSAFVTRGGDISGFLTVNLSSSDTSEAVVPASVNFQAGSAMSDPFTIDAIDDMLLDGTQTVTITASLPEVATAMATIDVTDHETLTVMITPSSIAENDVLGAVGTVTRSNIDPGDTAFASALTVNLTSSDTTEATVPATVEIPASMASVTFPLTAVDDDLLDGTQTVTITGEAAGYVEGTDSIDVNDYELDFGDAPDPTYPTLLANNGARHVINDLKLGSIIDNEPDGQPSPDALGDGGAGGPQPMGVSGLNDEDGVYIPILYLGVMNQLTITASGSAAIPQGISKQNIGGQGITAIGYVDAWFDWNRNGSWDDPGEALLAQPVQAGSNPFTVTPPPGVAVSGATFARFRISQGGELAPTGLAVGGEVEDYLVTVHGSPSITYPEEAYTLASGEDAGAIAPTNNGDPATSWSIFPPLPSGLNFNTGNGAITGTPTGISVNTYTVTATNPAGMSQFAMIIAVNGPRLLVAIGEASISEKDGAGMGTVTLPDGQTAEGLIEISLASDDISEATVPPIVLIPPGESSALFPIAGVDDTLLDGTQTVKITATATVGGEPVVDYSPSSDTIDVTDRETLMVTAPSGASVFEWADDVQLRVTRSNTDNSQALTVNLTSDDTSEVATPATVTIPAEAASVVFFASVIDDDQIDGDQIATVSAEAAGYFQGDLGVQVKDHELDFGDAPDTSNGTGPGDYQTLGEFGGASHVIGQ